mgnify:CR=1 FL=1
MKNILVPTDFSNCANAAFDFALDFAERANALIHFLHLLSTPVDWVKLPLDKEQNYPETKKQIGHAKAELNKWVRKAERKNIDALHSLVFNRGREEIFQFIEQHHTDFIIMGSHGANGIRESIIGTNAQKVIRKSAVPVLVVKKEVSNPIKNVLFVSDFTDVSKGAYHKIIHFADIIEAHIELLFVNTPDEFVQSKETDANMDAVLLHCNRKDACTKNVINANTGEAGVRDFVGKQPIDMIAICTHGKSGLRQLFSPSIAETIVNHTELPLLSIKL